MSAKGTIRNSRECAGSVAQTRATVGFRAHSGWAALVAVAEPVRLAVVIDRRRVELADLKVPRPVQPYHAAQELELKEAEKYVKHFATQAKLLAQRALRDVIDHLKAANYLVVGCGIPLGSGRPATTLEATLASHSMLHTAEGELFRNALIQASEHFQLPVAGIRERDCRNGIKELVSGGLKALAAPELSSAVL